jgi:hypothetical protein
MSSGFAPWRRALDESEALSIDIGATSVTGVRANAAPQAAGRIGRSAHPVFGTLPLATSDSRSIGSDCARMGFVFDPSRYRDDEFVDAFGISWLNTDNAPAPFKHPLQAATKSQIARYRKPLWPSSIQVSARRDESELIIADAPCPGLLDLCFGLRNAWHFIDDIASGSAAASALLDWSLDTILAGYQRLLTVLPEVPDIVLYGDDYGFRSGMFLSVEEFRRHFKPRLHVLFEAIRKLAPGTAICFHSCGAIRPLLSEIADLGVELVNLDGRAKEMSVDNVRALLPDHVIMHGCVDLVALGQALSDRNLASVALLTTELANSAPVIAAPLDAIADPKALVVAIVAGSYLRALGPDGLATIARLGPVRDLISSAIDTVVNSPIASLGGEMPTLINLETLSIKPQAPRFSSDFSMPRKVKAQPI